MKLNFVVRSSKARKNGLCPIELSIIINGERRVISLDRQINPKHWNAKSQTVRNNPEINAYLQAIITKAYITQTDMLKLGMIFNINTFIQAFKFGVTPSISIINLYEKHNNNYQQKVNNSQVSKATLGKYQKALDYLKQYIQSIYHTQDLDVSSITPEFIEGHMSYLLQFMENNSAVKIMKRLKKILLIAIEEGYIQNNPFKLKFKEDKVIHNPLSTTQLQEIRNYLIINSSSTQRLINVGYCFLFQCYTGLSYCDMASLTKDNIKDGMIIINRQKTNVQSVIPLLPQAKEILERYDYKLPVLSNQKYNSYLKEIQDICKIPQTLHSHLARHTFATQLLNNNVPLPVIARCMGHSTTKITEKTYAKLHNETVYHSVMAIQNAI